MLIKKEMVNRSTILKHLKYHGKYERKHFTMKKLELETQCKELGIDLSQPIINEPVPGKVQPVTKPKVVLQEPDYDSSDEDDELLNDPVPTPAPTPSPPEKKLKRKTQECVVKSIPAPGKDPVREVNDLLKDLNRVIKELFDEFDRPEDIDQVDEEYIRSEFNLIINDIQDLIDPLIKDFSDSAIKKIEKKIDIMYLKLERFLG